MALAKRETMVEWLARETKMVVVERAGDYYTLIANDHRARQNVQVHSGENVRSVLFQGWPTLRFPLANPPHGLFGRLLLRNLEQTYAFWCVSISESCEASPTLVARIPVEALSPTLFKLVCDEIIDEIDAFRKELHDRFQYDLGDVRQPPPSGAGVPAKRPGGGIERFR